MRKIKGWEIGLFLGIQFVVVVIDLAIIVVGIFMFEKPGAFEFSALIGFVVLLYPIELLAYYLFRRAVPLKAGDVPPGSFKESIYHLEALFHICVFHPVTTSNILPVPMRRFWYRGLGGKIGKNTYPAGTLMDPRFVELGDNCVIGFGSMLVPHIMMGKSLSHEKIRVGHNVTIGVQTVIYGGSVIEDNALIMPLSSVNPGTHIKEGEIWGGSPARKVRSKVDNPHLSKIAHG